MKFIATYCLSACLAVAGAAQTAPSSSSATQAPVPYASMSQVNLLISQLEQVSQGMQADLSKLRIDKWKTDSNTKRGTQADLESIQRNLQGALPEMINQLKNSPEGLEPTFKLYRNLDALYDVFSSVVESAGAFGSRDDYQSLQNSLSELERARRSFAERMEGLASSKEQELTQLRTQVRTLQAQATPPTPAKKVVVDDTQPAKPVKKKPASKTKKNPSAATPTTPANSSPPPTPQQ